MTTLLTPQTPKRLTTITSPPPPLPPSPHQREGWGDINWEMFARSGQISIREAEVVRLGEVNSLEWVLANKSDSYAYAHALLTCLKKLTSSSELTHYILTRILDVLRTDQSVLKGVSACELFFDKAADSENNGGDERCFIENYKLLEPCLDSNDPYITTCASVAISCILTGLLQTTPALETSPVVVAQVDKFSNWVIGMMQKGVKTLDCVVPCLTVMCKVSMCRDVIGDMGGVGFISKFLSLGSSGGSGGGGGMSDDVTYVTHSTPHLSQPVLSAQTTYNLTFTLWTLSYSSSSSVRSDFLKHDTTSVLCSLCSNGAREKVIRCALASLINLSNDVTSVPGEDARVYSEGSAMLGATFLNEMLSNGNNFIACIKHLKERKWGTDVDIVNDISTIYTRLLDNYKEYTTLEKYTAEVMGGKLKWSGVHSDGFFKDNIMLFERDDFKLLKALVLLLSTSTDEETLEVALYDIGQFTRYYPSGRSLIRKLGGKDKALELCDFGGSEGVRREALGCVQKIMVSNWEFLA